jgi:small-conductance mechanosensitive channel
VPCGHSAGGVLFDECDACFLVLMAKRIIDALIFLSVLMSALLFLYAGVLYLLAPTSSENIRKGHKVFVNALVGLIVVLAAWLIIAVFMEYLFVGSDLAGRMHVTGDDWGDVLCETAPLGSG